MYTLDEDKLKKELRLLTPEEFTVFADDVEYLYAKSGRFGTTIKFENKNMMFLKDSKWVPSSELTSKHKINVRISGLQGFKFSKEI